MASHGLRLRNKIAPPRFLTFVALILVGAPVASSFLGCADGAMAAFDFAALIFFLLAIPLFDDKADEMRQSAKANDANRAGLLVITGIVSIAVLVSVASELLQQGKPNMPKAALIVGTLILSWLFSSLIYALHYAHMFYTGDDGKDEQGVKFPDTVEPDYWDFIYFATYLSMTFQGS